MESVSGGVGKPAWVPIARARALLEGGDRAGAVVALLEASAERPRCADLHTDICSLLADLGQVDASVGAGHVAVEHDRWNARAHAELGRAQFLAGQLAEALASCAEALALAPDNLGAMVTLSAALYTLGFQEEACRAAENAVAMNPRHFQARANLALAYEALGRLDRAEAHSRAALALDPCCAPARHNLAALLLGRGKLDAESWLFYESRLGLTPEARKLAAIPRWRGEDVTGRTVLLHAEQGCGDVIQFCRYAPLVAARGARVILAVQAELVRLLRGLAGVDEVIAVGSGLPAHDVFCPLASLPGVFGTTLETIPGAVPYLRAMEGIAARFRPELNGGLQVGLVWAGNREFKHDRLRSMPGETLRALMDLPGVTFHSLQKEGELPFPMRDRMGEVTDFADTAGIVAGLHLVITVDTGVAHLAAAMGKPVWLLSRFMGCWRWLRDREDSPWYPTVRVFRQARPRDWDGVMQDVRGALERELAEGSLIGVAKRASLRSHLGEKVSG